ncbi:IclR family transcriptional regulator [Microlunatus elymi]|uniref:IclR family transcriptional regulator n=1 Tax=Microlunatus elymi TaxID=2596828 RepID=UPI001AEF8BD0|nr:IclR family transcriptional regulator C-terminal domain-containing protein [Microlunatus elymi]
MSRSFAAVTHPSNKDALNATAVGKVLLAHMPGDDADDIIRTLSFEPRTERTIATPTRLRQQLVRIRRLGYATCVGENYPDVNGIAAPLQDSDGNVTAAICINGPASRLTPAKLRDHLPLLPAFRGRVLPSAELKCLLGGGGWVRSMHPEVGRAIIEVHTDEHPDHYWTVPPLLGAFPTGHLTDRIPQDCISRTVVR